MMRILPVILLLALLSPAQAFRKREVWGKTTKVQPDAQTGGWYINLGITGIRAVINQDTPKEFEVAYVFDGTPASGKLNKGDHIVGVNGVAFSAPHKFGYGLDFFGYEGPVMELGVALESSQVTQGGKLKLAVRRKAAEGEKAEVQIIELSLGKKYGAFSKTYPYDCPKTKLILKEGYAYLLTKQKEDGSWHGRPHINAFAALALMGSSHKEHLEAAGKAARYCAKVTNDQISYGGLDCWKYGLYGAVLGEYYLMTRETWVLNELEEINRWLHKAQMENGGWGHRPSDRPGGNGYGAINVITMQAKMAWALMTRCGIEVDQKRYRAAHEFVKRGTNAIGYVWYKDGGKKNPNYADMGRTGASAVAHYLSPVGGKEYLDTAKLNASCIGNHPTTFPDTHGSPLLGMAWTALGALPDPEAFRKLMDYNRWHFALAQCPDGTFYYQPNRDNNAQDYSAAPRLSATATNLLILSVQSKRLQMTGAQPVALPTP